MTAVTQWFSPQTPPKREGVYQKRCHDNSIGYQFWGGAKWGAWALDAATAEVRKDWHTSFVLHLWRGLAEKPE